MGVPKFYRWVVDRYPAVLADWHKEGQEQEQKSSGTASNLNGPPIDAIYFDMNGIIHNCSHNDTDITTNKESSAEIVAKKVWIEVDYLVSHMVKPQKLVYIAIDGVAPRAKLNQQRTRRFRSAHERTTRIAKAQDKESVADLFDSNCITPGTLFMEEISRRLIASIQAAINESPAWRNLEVVFSGSEVPGEGEHKIISYIREQKAAGAIPANIRHCICGADADVIMLGLATHEPFMVILREAPDYMQPGSRKSDKVPDNTESSLKTDLDESHPNHHNHSIGLTVDIAISADLAPLVPMYSKKLMQFIRLHTLREYLCRELLHDLHLPSHSYDREKVVDDFVFLTFLVGNDFLPHLPAIEIGDKAFDVIFDAYRLALKQETGYLVRNGELDYNRLELILGIISSTEAVKFQEKESTRAGKQHRHQQRLLLKEQGSAKELQDGLESMIISNVENASREALQEYDDSSNKHHHGRHSRNNSNNNNYNIHDNNPVSTKSYEDLREEYYQEKFHFDLGTEQGKESLQRVVRDYLAGLTWCLAYYTKGCISWSWYYPYHYGIFLSDMTNLQAIAQSIRLDLSTPLYPFQQLLACLPPASSSLLPPCYSYLMSDHSSPILEYYPLRFELDFNGKKNAYEAVVILPFIDSDRLNQAEAIFCPTDKLTEAEKQRNSFGKIKVFHGRNGLERVDILDYSILPSRAFEATLIAGTQESLPGYPSLSDLLTWNLSGKVRYGGRDGGRFNLGGRGRFNLGGRGRFHGRGNHQQSKSTDSPAFPMPGLVSEPAAFPAFAPNDFNSSTNTISTPISPFVDSLPQTGGIAVRLVLDEQMDQILRALMTKISEVAPAFVPYEGLHGLVFRVEDFLWNCGYPSIPKELSHKLDHILQQIAISFPSIRGRLLPRAISIHGSHMIAIEVHIEEPFTRLETSIAQQLIFQLSKMNLPEDSFDAVTLFEKCIVVGEFHESEDMNQGSFLVWFTGELARFCSIVSNFSSHILQYEEFSEEKESIKQYSLAGHHQK